VYLVNLMRFVIILIKLLCMYVTAKVQGPYELSTTTVTGSIRPIIFLLAS